uniref:Uncharacterized protein n=1 Tax=Onchocerca volvulus TaxID=6282 RepID=A0A8R1XX63_ONCVO
MHLIKPNLNGSPGFRKLYWHHTTNELLLHSIDEKIIAGYRIRLIFRFTSQSDQEMSRCRYGNLICNASDISSEKIGV